jgi:hypothetical protein
MYLNPKVHALPDRGREDIECVEVIGLDVMVCCEWRFVFV